MKLDYTIRGIIIEIKNEIKKEEGIDLSEQEIFEICDSQFVGATLARLKKISYSLAYIGNFLFKDLTYYFHNVKESKKAMKDMNEKEKKDFITKKKIFHKQNFKGSKMKLIKKLEDLPEDASNTKEFDSYKDMFKEIVYKERNNE